MTVAYPDALPPDPGAPAPAGPPNGPLNGTVYPQLWADLRSAQRSITVQMYYSLPGAVADTMAAILKERARAHVRVLFLVDAFGSQGLSRKWIESLRAGGVEVQKFRKVRWFTIHNATDRSHVRVIGFVLRLDCEWHAGYPSPVKRAIASGESIARKRTRSHPRASPRCCEKITRARDLRPSR